MYYYPGTSVIQSVRIITLYLLVYTWPKTFSKIALLTAEHQLPLSLQSIFWDERFTQSRQEEPHQVIEPLAPFPFHNPHCERIRRDTKGFSLVLIYFNSPFSLSLSVRDLRPWAWGRATQE